LRTLFSFAREGKVRHYRSLLDSSFTAIPTFVAQKLATRATLIMKTSSLLPIAFASRATFALDIRQANQNKVYFPPQQASNDVIQNFAVHAGDTFNITWDTSYPAVDLRILASAAHSNFTVTPSVSLHPPESTN
jgi:hypothetical protein